MKWVYAMMVLASSCSVAFSQQVVVEDKRSGSKIITFERAANAQAAADRATAAERRCGRYITAAPGVLTIHESPGVCSVKIIDLPQTHIPDPSQ